MYTTLARVRTEVKEDSNISKPLDDAYLVEALRFVAARLDAYGDTQQRREFAPRISTRYFDALEIGRGGHIDYRDLWLDRELLSVTTITNGDGVVVGSTNYVLFPRDDVPTTRVHLTAASGLYWTYTLDPIGAISILGTWGYHSRPSEMWLTSGDTVENNPLSSSGTSITVNDADGADGRNRTPRFSPGQLIRIESEYCEIMAVNLTNNTLTVLRGQRGSTAAAHVQNTAIDVFSADATIERAAIRWAAYLYHRRAQFNTSTYDGATGISVQFPPDMPSEVENILAALPKRLTVKAIS